MCITHSVDDHIQDKSWILSSCHVNSVLVVLHSLCLCCMSAITDKEFFSWDCICVHGFLFGSFVFLFLLGGCWWGVFPGCQVRLTLYFPFITCPITIFVLSLGWSTIGFLPCQVLMDYVRAWIIQMLCSSQVFGNMCAASGFDRRAATSERFHYPCWVENINSVYCTNWMVCILFPNSSRCRNRCSSKFWFLSWLHFCQVLLSLSSLPLFLVLGIGRSIVHGILLYILFALVCPCRRRPSGLI